MAHIICVDLVVLILCHSWLNCTQSLASGIAVWEAHHLDAIRPLVRGLSRNVTAYSANKLMLKSY